MPPRTPTITSGSLAPGDAATLSETYSNKNARHRQDAHAGRHVHDGSAANYAITFVNDTTGVITARAITVTAATDTKTYDGTTSAAAIPTITSGTLRR